jgi:phage shock protein PspC (stress-responsive transcriptional regulator)
MFNPAPLSDIGHVIQLAIAPVFLLTAIATILNVLTGRLGRAVDRRRVLAAALPKLDGEIAGLARQELEYEMRRIRLIYVAITMAVFAALLVAALISLAFIDPFVQLEFTTLIAVLFVLAMLALVTSLAILLREIFHAVNSPRAPVV